MAIGFLIAAAVIVAGTAVAVIVGRSLERARTERQIERLSGSADRPAVERVDFEAFTALPSPVARYFRHVLTQGQPLISTATVRQSGVLRTRPTADKWLSFQATQFAVPPAIGFVWDARVAMPWGTHVRVVDAYSVGTGSGRVSFLSALVLASEAGTPELNSAALLRYLAEAVWFPTALLPQTGVEWSPIDEQSALATLANRNTRVALEFRFHPNGEVAGVYSPGRFGRFAGGYKKMPWEGRFGDYSPVAGMRIPMRAEVGWYIDRRLRTVWKGEVVAVDYRTG